MRRTSTRYLILNPPNPPIIPFCFVFPFLATNLLESYALLSIILYLLSQIQEKNSLINTSHYFSNISYSLHFKMAPHKYNLLRSPRPGESSDEDDKVGVAVSNDAELDVVKQSTSSRFVGYRTVFISLGASILTAALLIVIFVFDQASVPVCLSHRTRREWRQLNDTEKAHYIQAVKCLQTFPFPNNRNRPPLGRFSLGASPRSDIKQVNTYLFFKL